MIAMYNRLGFSPQASNILYTDQGMAELSEISILCDAEVELLCKIVHRPGGLIPNPNTAGAGQAPMINAPGHAVSMRAVTNLKLA